MFVVSKLFWWVFEPSNVLLILLIAGTALLWTRWRRLGRAVVAGTVAIAAAIAILPVGTWLRLPLENRFPAVTALPDRVAGIIVLGGAVRQHLTDARGQVALTDGAERMTATVALARRHPRARIVFTGGSASLSRPRLKESLVARRFFAEMGVPDGRIEYEENSRNTHENAVLTRRLIDPARDDVWVLVTSALHMPRAVGAFRRAGWHVLPYPVDYTTEGRGGFDPGFAFSAGLSGVSAGVHEWVGLIAYRLLGWTDSLFPGPQPGRIARPDSRLSPALNHGS